MRTDIRLAYAAPAIAAKQRAVVEPQLRDMRAGRPILLFRVIGDILAQIVPTLPTPITLLDAGCGSAYYSEVVEHFTPHCYTYHGVDYNPGMVALAHELYPALAVHQADLCSLDFDDRSFDVVLSGACIAHIPEWRVALSEITRVAGIYLVLHRNPIYLDDSPTTFDYRDDYDAGIWVHQFNERELLSGITADFDVLVTRDACTPTARTVTRTYLLERKPQEKATRGDHT